MAELSAAQKTARTRRQHEKKIRAALEPYRAELRKRWQEVAETGESDRPCILCEQAGPGRCFACPVFACPVFGEAVFGEGRSQHCSNFIPPEPSGVEATAREVRITVAGPDRVAVVKKTGAPRARQTPRERAREYGRQMLALLDGAGEVESEAPAAHSPAGPAAPPLWGGALT